MPLRLTLNGVYEEVSPSLGRGDDIWRSQSQSPPATWAPVDASSPPARSDGIQRSHSPVATWTPLETNPPPARRDDLQRSPSTAAMWSPLETSPPPVRSHEIRRSLSPTATWAPLSPTWTQVSPTAPVSLPSYPLPIMASGGAEPCEKNEEATVQAAWDKFFAGFTQKDLSKTLSCFEDSAHLRVFNSLDGVKMEYQGLEAIGQFYGELLGDHCGEYSLEVELVDIDEEAGQVFIVWRCPKGGILSATSTFIYSRNMSIWKENMVLTKVSTLAAALIPFGPPSSPGLDRLIGSKTAAALRGSPVF